MQGFRLLNYSSLQSCFGTTKVVGNRNSRKSEIFSKMSESEIGRKKTSEIGSRKSEFLNSSGSL
jgi:hypothetical protein